MKSRHNLIKPIFLHLHKDFIAAKRAKIVNYLNMAEIEEEEKKHKENVQNEVSDYEMSEEEVVETGCGIDHSLPTKQNMDETDSSVNESDSEYQRIMAEIAQPPNSIRIKCGP